MSDAVRETLDRYYAALNAGDRAGLRGVLAGDTVITVLRGEWTVKATGRKVQTETVNMFTMRDGKVTRYQVFSDTAALGLGLGRLAAA